MFWAFRPAHDGALKPLAEKLLTLKREVSRIDRRGTARPNAGVLGFGVPAIDQMLPASGLPRGELHEACGAGAQTEHATAAALFVAGLLGRASGDVAWVLERPDIYPPALAGVGLHPHRVFFVHARKPEMVLQVMEDCLRHPGLAGVVGELSGPLSLTASRRLQLAAEGSGVTAFLIRRSRRFDDPVLRAPSAAATRWQLAALPSPPALAHAPEVPGLGAALWKLDLIRCRGGEAQSWIVEAFDASGRCRLVPDLGDRPAAPYPRRVAA